MVSQFSKDGKYFASLSVDGKLKVWDTATSKLEQEYTPDFHLTSPCTCLHFINPTNSNKKSGSPKKKIKRRDSLEPESNYVVLGTTSGFLLVYSITKAEVDFTIDSKTTRPINCLSWHDGTQVYSAADFNILTWDLNKKSLTSKWKAGNEKITCILVTPEQDKILTAARSIKLWSTESKEVLRTFTGHSSDISILKFVDPGKTDLYFLSGSKDDRNLSCWNINDDSKNAVANFLMEDIALNVAVKTDADGSTKLAAVTRSGVCHIYQHTLNGKGNKPFKPKTTVTVASDPEPNTRNVMPIPIISSIFQDDSSLKIAHGNSLVLTFENVVLSMYEKVQCLIRTHPKTTKKHQEEVFVSKIKTPITDDDVHYLTPHTGVGVGKRKASGSGANEVPMEKRLENLTLNKLDSTSKVPKANNVAQLLVQGLQSNDKTILMSVLNTRDEVVIQNTVKRLPLTVIMPFVEELTNLLKKKTLFCQFGALWMKQILQTHAGLLVSNPDLAQILGPVLSSIESRLSLQMPLCRLKGRLDLLVSQMNSTKTSEDAKEDDALLVFNDKASSDSEMEMMELGAHSESDNEWTEESGEDEMEAEAEGEVEENGDENSDDDDEMSI